MEVFLVGGAVRDRLLGLPVKDRDWVVVGATPEEMLTRGYQPVGKDFPVFLHPQSHEEYALARTERKQGLGHTGFAIYAAPDVTLEADLARRDLTINAIAETPDGQLIDPWNGVSDLHHRLLRHVSPAFSEDPLRVLRVARFAARLAPLGFTIAGETLALMKSMAASGELGSLVTERVWQETRLALESDRPASYFEVLHTTGAMVLLMPELAGLFEMPERADGQASPEQPWSNRGEQALKVLNQAARLTEDSAVRFAALAPWITSDKTPANPPKDRRYQEQPDLLLVRRLCQRLRVPNTFQALALLTGQYNHLIQRVLTLDNQAIIQLMTHCDAWRRPDRFRGVLLACEAQTGTGNARWPQGQLLRQALTATGAITAQPLLEKGFRGPALGAQLQQERLDCLFHLRESMNQEASKPHDP